MKKKIGLILFFTFYLLVILLRLANHFPWFDEAHAWIIAQEVSLNDLLSVIRIEGHPFLWFIMLMPFAKTGILYPSAMYFLNALFLLFAIGILWKKSSFTTLTKILITISYPFFALYPIIARNYSIGIFFLFLLTAFFKEKFKHPIIYTICILLCINSSVMAFFGATAFSILFILDYFREKPELKNITILVFNIILGYFLIFIQFFNKSTAVNLSINSNKNILENLFIQNSLDINILLLIIFGALIFYYFLKNKDKIQIFYLCFTYICLTLCFVFIYPAGIWHSYFYYVYFIIALWLSKPSKFRTTLLCTVSFLLVFNYPNAELSKHLYGSEGKLILNTILEDSTLKNAHIIHNNGTVYTIVPYAKKYNLDISNYCNNPKGNYDLTTIKASNKFCKHDDGISEVQERPERFVKQITDNTIMITSDRYEANKYILSNNKNHIYIEKYKCKYDFCYWKVIKF